MTEVITWLTFGVVQLVLVGAALAVLARPARDRGRRAAVIMLAAGSILIVANLAWAVTGGPEGRSPIAMRGGMLGFWLSLATGLEVGLLGAIARLRARG